jgi:hypothetical protein
MLQTGAKELLFLTGRNRVVGCGSYRGASRQYGLPTAGNDIVRGQLDNIPGRVVLIRIVATHPRPALTWQP